MDYFREKVLPPLLKWPGGKSSDLKILKHDFSELFPKTIKNYYEPFLGGGAVWLALKPRKMFVNDISEDLIDFYSRIKEQDIDFFKNIQTMSNIWKLLGEIAIKHSENFYNGDLTNFKKYKALLQDEDCFLTIMSILDKKIKRIYTSEIKRKVKLNSEDRLKNIEGALKAGYYTFIRKIYNKHKERDALRSAAFYFIRDYCFSSMFRFNDKGDFNVPYGGISYNSRDPAAKLDYLSYEELKKHLKQTKFVSLDFELFLNKYKPDAEDFLFIDPPYDSEFSTYDKNEFTREDQQRLADYLINKTNAQFLAVMKNTKFISDLYQGNEDKNISCNIFDKDYTVSFKDRNDKEVEHLIVCRTLK
jgi:DNA adenine methylase